MKDSSSADAGLVIGGARDAAEKDADEMAERVMRSRRPDDAVLPKCVDCSGEKNRLRRSPSEAGEEETVQAKSARHTTPAATGATPASPATTAAIKSLGTGQPLARAERAFFEPRFGADLGSVRVHNGPAAHRASRMLDARAFALGDDIAFARGERQAGTEKGCRLMAHELAHVVADRDSVGRQVRRDLAVAPPRPEDVPRALTERQYERARRYNERRFEDPFTISIVRDVLGIDKYPAVVDRAFTDAVLRWQAVFGIAEDGKFGPSSTRRVVRVLRAEGNNRLARLVRGDNFVDVRTVLGPTFFGCAGAPGHPGRAFEWNVSFRTSLRNGFIVQRIDNVWNQNPAPAPGQAVPTPRYFEAWAVDGGGRVTPVVGGVNDMWRRPMRAGTRGNWQMSARLYTVLHLPATFGAGNVADAGPVLRSQLANPGANLLGLPEGFTVIERGDEGARRIGGQWDCADPVVANRFHRRR